MNIPQPPIDAKTERHVWRADITGLRALAVIPVVLYHAFPALMPGGFTGVDIFFVISGFLISGILFRSLESTGGVNYRDFYAKRIRRILPNLILLLAAVAAAGWFLMTPGEYQALGRQIFSSAGFVQNFRLLKAIGDYFAPSVAETPLLHLWSLAIEEQFYIVFPLLLWAVWRLCGTKHGAAGIGLLSLVVTAGSFILCLVAKDPVWRFYFPLTRFWELGAGILLSYAMTFGGLRRTVLPRIAGTAASLGGLTLVLTGFLTLSQGSDFPGVGTLLPVAGAVLLILAGPEAPVNRLLATRIPVFIGLISYSLYLWHWPVLSFLTIAVGAPTTAQMLLALLASFAASVLVYACVENPVRRMGKGREGRNAVVLLLIGLLLAYAGGQAIRLLHGLPKRNVPIVNLIGDREKDWHCNDMLEPALINGVNVLVTPGAAPRVLFVGDSHAEQYVPRVMKLAGQGGAGAAFLTVPGCLAVPGIAGSDKGSAEGCRAFGENFRKLLGSGRFEHVVWANMFGRYLHEHTAVTDLEANAVLPLDEGGFEAGVRNFLRVRAEAAPEAPLTVILDVPWMDDWKNHCQFPDTNRLEPGNIDGHVIDGSRERHWREGNALVRKVIGDAPGVSFLSPVGRICPGERCSYGLYRDDNHLRSSFVRDNAVWIDPIFRQ